MDRIELVRAAIASHEQTQALTDKIPYSDFEDSAYLAGVEEAGNDLRNRLDGLLGTLEKRLLQLTQITKQKQAWKI